MGPNTTTFIVVLVVCFVVCPLIVAGIFFGVRYCVKRRSLERNVIIGSDVTTEAEMQLQQNGGAGGAGSHGSAGKFNTDQQLQQDFKKMDKQTYASQLPPHRGSDGYFDLDTFLEIYHPKTGRPPPTSEDYFNQMHKHNMKINDQQQRNGGSGNGNGDAGMSGRSSPNPYQYGGRASSLPGGGGSRQQQQQQQQRSGGASGGGGGGGGRNYNIDQLLTPEIIQAFYEFYSRYDPSKLESYLDSLTTLAQKCGPAYIDKMMPVLYNKYGDIPKWKGGPRMK